MLPFLHGVDSIRMLLYYRKTALETAKDTQLWNSTATEYGRDWVG